MNSFLSIFVFNKNIALPKPKVIIAYGFISQKIGDCKHAWIWEWEWEWDHVKRIILFPERDINAVRELIEHLRNFAFIPVLLVNKDAVSDVLEICQYDPLLKFELVYTQVTTLEEYASLVIKPEKEVMNVWRILCEGGRIDNASLPWTNFDFSFNYGLSFGIWLSHQNDSSLCPQKPFDLLHFHYADCRDGSYYLTHRGFPIAWLALANINGVWNVALGGALAGVQSVEKMRFRWKNKNYALANIPQDVLTLLLDSQPIEQNTQVKIKKNKKMPSTKRSWFYIAMPTALVTAVVMFLTVPLWYKFTISNEDYSGFRSSSTKPIQSANKFKTREDHLAYISDLVISGQIDEAIKELQTFKQAYPK